MTTIGQLKKYLDNFNETDFVTVSIWMRDGAHYFVPNIPACDPIKFTTIENYSAAVIGCADFCVAHQVIRKGELSCTH